MEMAPRTTQAQLPVGHPMAHERRGTVLRCLHALLAEGS